MPTDQCRAVWNNYVVWQVKPSDESVAARVVAKVSPGVLVGCAIQ